MFDAPSPFDGPEVLARRRARRLGAVAGALAVIAAFYHAFVYVRDRPPPNEAERFADVAPFVEFDQPAPEEWVGRLADDWPGLADPAALDAVCAELALRLKPSADQSISLSGPEGTVRTCAPAH